MKKESKKMKTILPAGIFCRFRYHFRLGGRERPATGKNRALSTS
ncbi:hypothetical protein ACNKHW_14070 [Shigella flexneri]